MAAPWCWWSAQALRTPTGDGTPIDPVEPVPSHSPVWPLRAWAARWLDWLDHDWVEREPGADGLDGDR